MAERLPSQRVAPTRVSFVVPPAAERVGGIDTALEGLSRHLTARHGIVLQRSESRVDASCDLAHFHGMWQTQHRQTYRQCLAGDVPYVVSPHGMLEPWAWRHKIWKKWPYYQLIERRQLRHAAAILAASDLEADNLTRFVGGSRVAVLPFGIDETALPDRGEAREHLGFRNDERVLLYLSRVDQKKGLDLLLEALRGAGMDGWRLVIAGDGDPAFTRELQAFATDHSAALPSVTWAGAVWGARRWDYFAAADLFCLPTRSENFGFAVLEALWSGTPVVTTSATPWRQHRDIEGVHICDPEIPSLRHALTIARQQGYPEPFDRAALQRWCQETYHWQNVAARYAQTYQHIAASSPELCLPS